MCMFVWKMKFSGLDAASKQLGTGERGLVFLHSGWEKTFFFFVVVHSKMTLGNGYELQQGKLQLDRTKFRC